jgi:hypothetical protein
MMRTLLALGATLALTAPLAAADFDNSVAPGSFHLFNHPDGSKQGLGDADGDLIAETEVAYGFILTDFLPGVKYLAFDFNHAASTMKLTWKPNRNVLRIHGKAFVWATAGSLTAYAPLDSGIATIDFTFTGLVALQDGGSYDDLALNGSDFGSGTVTLPNGEVRSLQGKAREDGLIFQFGDFGGQGHRRFAEDADYYTNLDGRFSWSKGGEGGSGNQDKDTMTEGPEFAAGVAWVEDPLDTGKSPNDFLFVAKGRGALKEN